MCIVAGISCIAAFYITTHVNVNATDDNIIGPLIFIIIFIASTIFLVKYFIYLKYFYIYIYFLVGYCFIIF